MVTHQDNSTPPTSAAATLEILKVSMLVPARRHPTLIPTEKRLPTFTRVHFRMNNVTGCCFNTSSIHPVSFLSSRNDAIALTTGRFPSEATIMVPICCCSWFCWVFAQARRGVCYLVQCIRPTQNIGWGAHVHGEPLRSRKNHPREQMARQAEPCEEDFGRPQELALFDIILVS